MLARHLATGGEVIVPGLFWLEVDERPGPAPSLSVEDVVAALRDLDEFGMRDGRRRSEPAMLWGWTS